jgi:GNAT superfamily N-acetyltransferase
MIWPASITDKIGRKFKLRTKEFDEYGAHYYTAELISPEGVEAGYLWFRDEGDERMVFHDLQVYEEYSRAGLGSLLVHIVEKEAKRVRKKRIIGHVEASHHLSGKKEVLASWYQRLGYSVTPIESSSPDYYGTLEKTLTNG